MMSESRSFEALQINVPAELKHDLAMDAAKKRTTIRAIILQALASSGYDVLESELHDKRKSKSTDGKLNP